MADRNCVVFSVRSWISLLRLHPILLGLMFWRHDACRKRWMGTSALADGVCQTGVGRVIAWKWR